MTKEYPIYICSKTYNEFACNDNDVFDADPIKRNVAFTFKLSQTAETLQLADNLLKRVFGDLKEKAVWAKSQPIPPNNKRTTLVAAPYSGNSILITLEQDHFNYLKTHFYNQTTACQSLNGSTNLKCNFDILKVPAQEQAREKSEDFGFGDIYGSEPDILISRPVMGLTSTDVNRDSILTPSQLGLPSKMGGKRHQRKTKRRKHNKRKSHFKRK